MGQDRVQRDLPEAGGPSLRIYQMPVRDEESESQRKARSRLMRQSRRSTQVRAGAQAPGLREEGLRLDPWVQGRRGWGLDP